MNFELRHTVSKFRFGIFSYRKNIGKLAKLTKAETFFSKDIIPTEMINKILKFKK